MSKSLLRTLGAEELRGRRVLVRADLNVPLADGAVSDDTRIRASLPTLEHLTSSGASVVLMSHLGRPKGSRDPSFSLAPVAGRLSELMEAPVHFVPDTVGEDAQAAVQRLGPGEVLLLENTRFLPGETANDPDVARQLAAFGSLYVNDAFGSAHRAHASTAGVAEVIKEAGGAAVAGFLLEKELAFLGDTLAHPDRPFLAVMGGAKISGKIDVVEALLPRVDRLLIGGAMANTFFLALGLEVGKSLVEDDRVQMARELMDRAGDRLVLPVDCRVGDRIAADAEVRTVPRDAVGTEDLIADIGPDTERLYRELILEARTVLWNGPMGVFEMEPFAPGTVAVAHAVADATDAGAVSVLGGGDSAAAAERAGVSDRLTHVSTGGGASLEFLSGAELPGVAVLSDEED
jgi:phosphoglycerate kinase